MNSVYIYIHLSLSFSIYIYMVDKWSERGHNLRITYFSIIRIDD